MNLIKSALLLGLSGLLPVLPLSAQTNESQWFHFDAADEIVSSTMIENQFAYDASIAAWKYGLWLAWLEFVPGKGDELWVGQREKNGWKSKRKLRDKPGDYANPTVTLDDGGRPWLTYESTERGGNWEILFGNLEQPTMLDVALPMGTKVSSGINHRVAGRRNSKGFWIVSQAENAGQFDIAASYINERGLPIRSNPVGPNLLGGIVGNFTCTPNQNEWRPSAATTLDGTLHVVWDSHDGESYNVLVQSFERTPESAKLIAGSGAFEGSAQIASGGDDKLWISWEEDGGNWGKRYTARLPGRKDSTHMTDNLGPLHRFRRLHLAQLDKKNSKLTEYEIPQPSFELAHARTNAPDGLKDFGVFYENAQLVVDGKDRPWIVYRHFYVPWIGIELATHKQQNMRVYARCLLPDGWSKLYSFKEGQGDGMQRVSASGMLDGVAVAWTTGRTDRRKTKDPHGVAFAEIKIGNAKAVAPAKTTTRNLDSKPTEIESKPRQRPAAEVAGKRYELFYGDLHRHTDISLCFSPVDGTIDDAYRYAIDVAPLDFLGITDHTHDLQMGEPLAHIWWRSRKEVDRHALAGRFIPFFSYERSRGDTDHNVISLRGDMMRPHTYPLPQFWKELDTNTITIPHQPFNPALWKNKDNTHRTLLEIYQGMRNDIREKDAQEGLSGGHKFGIIASSDHLSTSASFACVWAEEPTRESLFRAMQARRTFGATAKIALKVTCDGHWMGEEFELKKMKPITVKVTPTATITALELVVDGKQTISAADLLQGPAGSELTWEIPPDASLAGKHIFFIRVSQSDGNHAWSSPLWIDIKP